MEKQEEEEMRKMEGTRPCLSSLPLDLTSDILSRLPAESVVMSRCVSKLWSSFTTLPYFINSFAARSSQRPCLLIFTVKSGNLVVFSLPIHGNLDKSSSSSSSSSSSYCHVDSVLMKYPDNCCLLHSNSVNGLICFNRSEGLVIWNPTMRRFLTLAKPESCWRDPTGFIGHDPVDGTYKALCMPAYGLHLKKERKNSNQPRILTLGRAQESWRFIQGSFEHFLYHYRGRCINGVLYYEAFLTSQFAGRCLMSFHVRSEKFHMIQVPWRVSHDLLTYEGKLASLGSFASDDAIELWVLEDAEQQQWSFRRFPLPFPLNDPISQTLLQLEGVTNAGEFVYLPTKDLLGPFHVLYFDPNRNSVRRVIYEGFADKESRRRNGLGNQSLFGVYTLPDHIESLVSL